jgi:tetratricopeptide (TPR) repeat protein
VQPDDNELQVQLISCEDGTVLWTYRETYDDSPFRSTGVIRSLAGRLSAKLREPPRVGPKQNSTWLKYLRAHHQWKLRTPDSILSAIDLYQEVVAAEPDFADAYAGLAEAYTVAPLYTGARPDRSYASAKAAAEQALLLDPDNARAHVALGVYYAQFEYDWIKSEYEFSRSIELDPNSAQAHQWMADAFCYRLLIDDCRYHYAVAYSLDPLNPLMDLMQGLPDRFAGDFAAAEEKFSGTLARYPDFALARYQLGLVLDAQGRFQEAIDQWERIYPRYGPALLASSLAHAYTQIGRLDLAEVLHNDLLRLREEEYVSAVMMAGMSLTRGSVQEALDWLEVSRSEHDDFFSEIAVIHHFAVLHDEPRFVAMVEDLGIPAERLRDYR